MIYVKAPALWKYWLDHSTRLREKLVLIAESDSAKIYLTNDSGDARFSVEVGQVVEDFRLEYPARVSLEVQYMELLIGCHILDEEEEPKESTNDVWTEAQTARVVRILDATEEFITTLLCGDLKDYCVNETDLEDIAFLVGQYLADHHDISINYPTEYHFDDEVVVVDYPFDDEEEGDCNDC